MVTFRKDHRVESSGRFQPSFDPTMEPRSGSVSSVTPKVVGVGWTEAIKLVPDARTITGMPDNRTTQETDSDV